MPNLNVQRLAVKRSAATSFVIPLMPQIPDAVLRRFPEMRTWQTEMEAWRQRLQAILKSEIDDLRAEDSP